MSPLLTINSYHEDNFIMDPEDLCILRWEFRKMGEPFTPFISVICFSEGLLCNRNDV